MWWDRWEHQLPDESGRKHGWKRKKYIILGRNGSVLTKIGKHYAKWVINMQIMGLFMQKWVSIKCNGLIWGKWLIWGKKWYLLCKMAHWEKYLITGQKEAPYNARWFISWQSSCLPGSFPQDPASVAADETKETGKFFPGSAQPFPHWHYYQVSEYRKT